MKRRLALISFIITFVWTAHEKPLWAQLPAGPVTGQTGSPSSNSSTSTTSSIYSQPAAPQGQSSFTGSVPSKFVPGSFTNIA